MTNLSEKELLMMLREDINNHQKQHVDLVWNSAKFNITVLSALLSILIAIFVLGFKEYSNFNDIAKILFNLIIILIPLFLIIFTYVGLWNFKRQYEHILEHVVIQAKIDDELGLIQESYRKQHRIFKDDKYIT